MKKTKIIVPALGMLLLSTAASVTGTVAWFAVNTSVTVTGLQVKAKAEGGIVIAPYTLTKTAITEDSGSGNSVTDASFAAPNANLFGASATTDLGVAELYPTSTATATAWYHATSNAVNNHAGVSGTYSTLAAGTANGAGFKLDGVQVDGAGTHENPFKNAGQYFSHTKYRVKSTNTVDKFDLFVRSIDVSDDANSADMNKSLRVAVKVGDASAAFFAPKYASNPGSLNWCSAVSGEGVGTVGAATLNFGETLNPGVQVANQTIVGTGDPAGIDMDIWVYYEGEDPNCKTINTEGITIDSLQLTFTFATTAA